VRDIKFRGIMIDNGEWVYGFYTEIEHNDDKSHIHAYIMPVPLLENQPKDKPALVEIDPETVGQYTGLKDKNGVEIYEGDTLRLDGYWDEVVTFNGGSFTVYGVNYPPCDFVIDRSHVAIREVIGNIHENADLLTKEE